MPATGNEAEWLTRKFRIDTKLRALNPAWQIIPWREGLNTSKLTCHAVTELPTENGPADYALFVNGILLGIIEAKKLTVHPQNVLEQARRYSKCPQINKPKFTAFHCFDGTLIEYFQNTTDFEIQRPTETPQTIAEVIENIWQNVDRDYHVRILAKRLRQIEKVGSGETRLEIGKWFAKAQAQVDKLTPRSSPAPSPANSCPRPHREPAEKLLNRIKKTYPRNP